MACNLDNSVNTNELKSVLDIFTFTEMALLRKLFQTLVGTVITRMACNLDSSVNTNELKSVLDIFTFTEMALLRKLFQTLVGTVVTRLCVHR